MDVDDDEIDFGLKYNRSCYCKNYIDRRVEKKRVVEDGEFEDC